MELTKFVQKYGTRSAAGPWIGANGVYVVSPACPTEFWEGERCDNKEPQNVKIGKASGENGFAGKGKGRLQMYRTYWPNGVTVHAILRTQNFDSTVHTVKDEALKRETTLRRIFKAHKLSGFGADGRGRNNGTRKLGSEWIRLTPDKIMNYLIAAGPLRHPNDKLYGCTWNSCEQVTLNKVSRNVTRLDSTVKTLEYVLDDERKNKKIGIRGRPVVLPRTILEAAKNPNHRLHRYAHLLKSNVDAEQNRATRRIADRTKRALAQRTLAQERALAQTRTRAERRMIRNAQLAKRAQNPEPRNLAAIRDTQEYALAAIPRPTPRVARPSPTPRVPKPTPRKTTRITPTKATKATKATSPTFCPLPRVQSLTPQYTYVDVTGDGRCYFYAILRALNLHAGGRTYGPQNANAAIQYLDPNKKEFWKRELSKARWHDPMDVLAHSVQMGRMFYDRGIRYITKVARTRKDLSELQNYIADPLTMIRSRGTDGIYEVSPDGRILMIPELSGKPPRRTGRAQEKRDDEQAFNKAFQEGRVITFVWRIIRGQPKHYELIAPKALPPPA